MLARLILACLVAFPSATVLAAANAADAAEVHVLGPLRIIDPWAKSAVGAAHEAKLFFEFDHAGTKPDRLLAATTPIASGPTKFRVVLIDSGQRHLGDIDAIEIPAEARGFELSEVGYYIELTGVQLPILMGKRFPVELRFENAGTLSVDFTARFHSPKLTRRIREAARRGDIEALKALK